MSKCIFYTHTSYLLSILGWFCWLHKTLVYLKGLQSHLQMKCKMLQTLHPQWWNASSSLPVLSTVRNSTLPRPQQNRKTTGGSAGNQENLSPVLFKQIKWKSLIKTMWLQVGSTEKTQHLIIVLNEVSCNSARSPFFPSSYLSAFHLFPNTE